MGVGAVERLGAGTDGPGRDIAGLAGNGRNADGTSRDPSCYDGRFRDVGFRVGSGRSGVGLPALGSRDGALPHGRNAHRGIPSTLRSARSGIRVITPRSAQLEVSVGTGRVRCPLPLVHRRIARSRRVPGRGQLEVALGLRTVPFRGNRPFTRWL
ncbi:hypothetical protein ABZ896_39500 [Streptomyces sp. NPDC047072]|uniref:hypothetical protein n=1 Tax=Streptomyces sp. NPDC047072 TaxID=3154809 RepID=UPI0033C5DCC6